MDVALRPAAQRAREVEDVVVGLVALADTQQLRREVGLGVVHLAQRDGDLHASSSSVASAAGPPTVGATSPSGRDAVVVGAGATLPSASATFSTRHAAVL